MVVAEYLLEIEGESRRPRALCIINKPEVVVAKEGGDQERDQHRGEIDDIGSIWSCAAEYKRKRQSKENLSIEVGVSRLSPLAAEFAPRMSGVGTELTVASVSSAGDSPPQKEQEINQEENVQDDELMFYDACESPDEKDPVTTSAVAAAQNHMDPSLENSENVINRTKGRDGVSTLSCTEADLSNVFGRTGP